jgi:hypothetical protein
MLQHEDEHQAEELQVNKNHLGNLHADFLYAKTERNAI